MNKIELLNELKSRNDLILKTAKLLFENMPKEKLEAQLNENSWSIAMCLDHLNYYFEHYAQKIEKATIEGEEAPESQQYKGKWLGKKFADMMTPKGKTIASKMASPRNTNPTKFGLRENYLEDFLSNMENFSALIEKSKKLNINSNKIATMFGPLVKLTLGDCLKVLVGHNERHFLQAKNVLEQL